MNSYEFHIGDYYRETRNLSQGEHYIYRSLLDECYLHEVPLTTDPKMLMRLIGIKSDQLEDLEFILDRFFMLTPDGWINNRVNEELARIYAKSAAAKASADARWEKHKKNANGMRTQCERNANGMLPLDPLTPLPSDPKELGATHLGKKASPSSPIPVQEIVNNWNDFAEINRLPKVVKVTNTLRGQIRQRWSDIPSMAQWDNFFDAIATSTFLSGKAPPGNGRTQPFRSTLLWITKETNFAKIAAGEYS